MQIIAPKGWTPGRTERREVRFADAPSTYDAETHSVECVISAGSAVQRVFGREILEISHAAVDLSRIPVPLLDSHSQASIDGVIGRIDPAWISGARLLGRIVFAQTPRGRLAEGMIARGELTGISAGYKVEEWSAVDADGDPVNPARASWDDDLTFTATRWVLLEGSLVGVPADGLAMVRSVGGGVDGVADIVARMNCRARMYARQAMHDREQEMRNEI